MSGADWVDPNKQNEKESIRKAFETLYPELANISIRYGKDDEQAEAMIYYGFYHFMSKVKTQLRNLNIEELLGLEFVRECVRFVKEIGGEIQISSTVHIRQDDDFRSAQKQEPDYSDLMNMDKDMLIRALRQLPPAQRLVFNLHIIEGYDLMKTAELMDSSLEAVKFSLEKARANFLKQFHNCNLRQVS